MLSFLPCSVVAGQRVIKLSEDQTRNIVRFSAKKPEERMKGINYSLQSAGISEDPLAKSFGVSVDEKMTQVIS